MRRLGHKLVAWVRRDAIDRELEEEIAFHIEMKSRDNAERGIAPGEARRRASIQFGSRNMVHEETRAMWGFGWLERLAADAAFALRVLRRNPGFAVISVVTLGLGIGLHSTAFTLVNGVALRGLPVANPETAFRAFPRFEGEFSRQIHGSSTMVSYPEYEQYRDAVRSVADLGVWADANLTLDGTEPETVRGVFVSGSYFELFGGAAALGRMLGPEDARTPGKEPVVVLSHGFWQRRFGGDPSVVGRTVTLNRLSFTVVGVASRIFYGTEPMVPKLWVPVTMQPQLVPGHAWLQGENEAWLDLVGRLKPGVPLRAAEAAINGVAGRMDASYPGRRTTIRLTDGSLVSHPEGRSRVLLVTSGVLLVVTFVLLVACANVANLLLSRGASRRREIGIRLSLGAARGRLVRQLVTESMVLGVLGGAAGLVLAYSLPDAILRWVDAPPMSFDLSPDLRVLGYTLLVSLATGVLFGLAPALDATRGHVSSALKNEGTFVGDRMRQSRLQALLVVFQVAVCSLFLVASALLLRGVQAASRLDPGFVVKDLLVASIDLSGIGYDGPAAADFRRRVLDRVEALPRVESAALAFNTPLGRGSSIGMLEVDGVASRSKPAVHYNAVSASYFATLGIPIVRGRGFTDREAGRESRPAVASETMARRFWPGEDALGKRFRVAAGSGAPSMSPRAHAEFQKQALRFVEFEVVGIAGDARNSSLAESDATFFYRPLEAEGQAGRVLLVRTTGGTAAAAAAVRAAAAGVNRNVAVSVRSMEQIVEMSLQQSRILTTAATSLGLLALVLAAGGIAGLVAFAVSLRTHEIGVRMALGARKPDIFRLILRQAMRPVVVGLVIGLAVAAAGSRVLTAALYGLSPLDPVAFAGVSLFLLGVAIAAAYLPARRAASVDPLAALRHE